MSHKKHKPLPTPNAGNTIHNNFSLLKDLRKYYGDTTATIRNSHESSVTIPIASLGMSIKTNSFYMLTKSDGVQMPKDLADKLFNSFNASMKNGWLDKHLDEHVDLFMKFGNLTKDEVYDRLYIGIIDRTACGGLESRLDIAIDTNNSVYTPQIIIGDSTTFKGSGMSTALLSFCLICMDCGGSYHTVDFNM